MFRRADSSDDEVIDISERLAPYGEADLSPEWRERYLLPDRPRARRVRADSLAPRHMAR